MIGRLVRALWAEPRVPLPPRGRTWWLDIAVVAVLVPTAVVEVVARDDVPWPAVTLVLTLVCVGAVPFRARFPLAMLLLAYGAQTAAGVGPALAGLPYGVPDTTAVVLFFPYSLARWASGRHVVVGLTLLLATHFAREPLYGSTTQDDLIGAGALLLPAAVGAGVRLWVVGRRREQEQVRHRERERLARELHDTVAHHVSGIVIQAQAGRAVAGADPSRALDVLRVIEEAATLSLVEMRSLVGVLRGDDAAERAPVRGVADLHLLSSDGSVVPGPVVRVDVDPDVAALPAAVDAAVYRVAQESVTNARWHATGAGRVDVRVEGAPDGVRVEVQDDGTGRPGARGRGSGRGIVGMRERVELLGGHLDAGPRPDGGWRVVATLPLTVQR